MGNLISGGLKAVLGFLPDSPFSGTLDSLAANTQVRQMLGMVNWFIPIYLFVPILTAWLAGVAVYYVYQIVLRWLRAIE